jgi:hypothetical protein
MAACSQLHGELIILTVTDPWVFFRHSIKNLLSASDIKPPLPLLGVPGLVGSAISSAFSFLEADFGVVGSDML